MIIRFGETETEQLPTPIPTEEVRVFLCPQSCIVDALRILRCSMERLARVHETCLTEIPRVRRKAVMLFPESQVKVDHDRQGVTRSHTRSGRVARIISHSIFLLFWRLSIH